MRRTSLLVLTGALLAGCGSSADRCAVETTSGACVSVVSVVPVMDKGMQTSDVDIVRSMCQASAGSEPVPEPFTDHDALITISNQPPVTYRDNPDLGPAIVFNSYSVIYKRNTACKGDCPAIGPLEFAGPSVTITGGNEGQISLPLVPLRTKLAFEGTAAGEEYPSYSALYTLSGKDPKSAFKITAAVEFTVGDFDNCGAQ